MGKPPDPPPIGAAPKAGYDHPRFKRVGPTDVKPPPGGYKSVINAKRPIDPAQAKKIANVKPAFKGRSLRTFGEVLSRSGNASRDAFARATADTSAGAIGRAIDKYATDYQRQAEKSRAEDMLAQRQNASDRFVMELYKAIFDKDTETRYDEGTKDLNQHYETEKKNEQAKRTAMLLSFLGGLL